MISKDTPYQFLQLSDVTLPQSTIPIMLTTYKYGIAEIPSDISTLKTLAAEGLTKVNLARGHSLCTLTDAGARWVEKHLFTILMECPLYLSYPVIVSRDEIQLMKDLAKPGSFGDPSFSGPSLSMDRGRYFVQQITHGRVTLVDDCDVPYQLNLTTSDKVLKFRPDQLKTLDDELKKRFHKIRIKSLVKRLSKVINTLTLTEWIEELYNKSYTQNRMGD